MRRVTMSTTNVNQLRNTGPAIRHGLQPGRRCVSQQRLAIWERGLRPSTPYFVGSLTKRLALRRVRLIDTEHILSACAMSAPPSGNCRSRGISAHASEVAPGVSGMGAFAEGGYLFAEGRHAKPSIDATDFLMPYVQALEHTHCSQQQQQASATGVSSL